MAHQVGVGELRPRPLVAVVVQRVAAQRRVGALADRVARRVAHAQVQDRGAERRHARGPHDAGVVVAGLDQRAHQPRHADAVGAHLGVHGPAVGSCNGEAHRLAVLGAEVEDVPDLDAPALAALALRHRIPGGEVVHLLGGGVAPGHALVERRQRLGIGACRQRGVVVGLERLVVEHLALAGRRQDDELVAQLAADRAGVGAHRDRAYAKALEGAQVGQHHAAVADDGALAVEVDAVGVLHQELAPAHHPEARAHLVAELPLDVVEHLRQLAVRLDRVAHDVGQHFLVGRPVQQVTLVAVAQTQHLRAVILVAAALAPQVGGLDGRHQDLLRAGRVLLLAHDLLDAAQHPQAGRQPGIDAGGTLPHQPRTQHQPVRDDLRLGGVFLERGHEGAGQAHR